MHALRILAILMWIMVFLAGIYLAMNRNVDPATVYAPESSMKQVPWKHLPNIPPFELTTAAGQPFESESLAGRPYAVSFFYSTCPDICRRLNSQVERLARQFRDEELTFLSITVDPATDTPQRLTQYSQVFDQDPDRWKFLTGTLSEIQQIGNFSFRVILDKAVHTEDILLVDRWGRFRDRFKWNSPDEMKRFARVAQEVLDETEPPLDKSISTRNLIAGNPHTAGNNPPWLNEFFLTRSDGREVYSRDLTGSVWIGSVFFSKCATHCVAQNKYLRDLQDRLPEKVKIVSVSTDAANDTPQRLTAYAREMNAQADRWWFLTSDDQDYLQHVAAEFFGLYVSGTDHATQIVVVDRWGVARAKFDWKDPQQEAEMFALIERLQQEQRPMPPERRRSEPPPEEDEGNSDS